MILGDEVLCHKKGESKRLVANMIAESAGNFIGTIISKVYQ